MVAVVVGCALRFTNLDRKVYSHDETLTSLRTSGFLFAEYERDVANRVLTVAQLQRFQHANDQRGTASTVRALAVDDPQHPPLYYLIERAWATLCGNSIAGRRSIGALFGALGIAALYWLCRELWPSDRTWALTAAALFAISPFQLQYAQQAREYTLWELVAIISSALLVRAERSGDLRLWLSYALAVALGLYTFLFFFLVVLAQIVYILGMQRVHRTKAWRPFFLALLAAVAAYLPWLINLGVQHNTVVETNAWFSTPVPAVVYLYKWLFNIGAVFFDAEYRNALLSVFLLPIAVLVAWSLYCTARSRVKPVGIFSLALFLATVIPILLPDLLLHQSRATAARYLAPAWIAVDLAVAYTLHAWWASRSRAKLANVTAVCLLGLGVVSWAASAPARAWWPASSEEPLLSIADTISDRPAALIATDDSAMALNLSNYLAPTARFDFSANPSVAALRAASANGAFLIAPRAALLSAISRTPDLRVDLAYRSLQTDSPMLRGTGMFSALRQRLAATRANAGLAAVDFSLWTVSASTVGVASSGAACVASPLVPIYSGCFTGNTPFHHTFAELLKAGATNQGQTVAANYWDQGTMTTDPAPSGYAYGLPMYFATDSDPAWDVACPTYGTCNAATKVTGKPVHLPAGAAASRDNDHHLIIVDESSQQEIDLWGGANTPRDNPAIGTDQCEIGTRTPGTITCSWGGVFPFRGTGMSTQQGMAGVAGGWAVGLFTISAGDLMQGHIDHALGIQAACLDAKTVYPSNHPGTDSVCHGDSHEREPNAVYGDLIHLKSSVDISSLGYSHYCQVILKAFQTYGAYLYDTNADRGAGIHFAMDVEGYANSPWFTTIFPSMAAGGDVRSDGGNHFSNFTYCLQRLSDRDIEVYQISPNLPPA